MSDQIEIGLNSIGLNMDGDHILIDDFSSRVAVPLTDAPAVAAAILKLAGAPDVTALVERLCEALGAADAHFGPFAEITINGLHDADDVRVVGLIRAVLAEAQAWRDSREGK